MNYYLAVLKKYAVFSGRAKRKEYWMFLLFNIIIAIGIGIIEGVIGSPGVLGMLYSLAIVIPGIAVSIRRLHDTGKSGWLLLIGFIPLLGAIALIIFMCQDSQVDSNQYGSNEPAT